MLRAVIATSIVFAACGGNDGPPAIVANGPTYTPLVANGLRAIAPACKLTRSPRSELHQCTGVKGRTEIVAVSDKLSKITIALHPMFFLEAKGHLTYALKTVLEPAHLDELLKKLENMPNPDQATLTLGKATIAATVSGRSKIAPEYTVVVTW